MRVLYWSSLFWPYIGGVENFGAKLLPALSQRGYEILVMTSHDYLILPDKETFKSVEIRRFHFREALGKGRLDRLVKLRHEVAQLRREFAPDLVHVNAHFGVADCFHALTAQAHPAPTVTTLHNQWKEQKGADSTVAQTTKNSDWVVCVSHSSLAQVQRVLPEIVDRSSVIYNGLEMPTLVPTPLPWDPPRILCLGRLSREKGFDLALMAFASLADRFPDLHMTIAGDGPERKFLESETVRLGLSSMVDFLGWVPPDRVPELINTATIVILPSRSEGLPLVVAEAGFMNRPAVATRVGGLPEVVSDQKTGVLVDPENSRQIANALADLIIHREKTLIMGQRARQQAKERFNWDQFVNNYTALYRRFETPRLEACDD
jgi:glycogen(starch) synthase